MNPLEAFPGGADEARKFIHYMRDDEPKLSVRSQAVCDLALLGLDSLAADPEREAKVEAAIAALADASYAVGQWDQEREPGPKLPGHLRANAEENAAMNALRALLRPAPPSPSAVADKIVRDVAELPDRDSPEDWPEAMLVTGDELRAIVLAALAASNANARGGE